VVVVVVVVVEQNSHIIGNATYQYLIVGQCFDADGVELLYVGSQH
jgi:hypothetical protein